MNNNTERENDNVFDLPKMNSLNLLPRNKQWLRVLCPNEKQYNLFMSEYFDINGIIGSMQTFRKNRLNIIYSTENKIKTFDKLNNCFETNDITTITKNLEEIFLEPIQDAELNLFEICKKNGYTAKDVFEITSKNIYINFIKVFKKFILKKKGN